MEQLLLTLSVAVLFFLRIGVPVIALAAIGIFIDHWQTKRELNSFHKPS